MQHNVGTADRIVRLVVAAAAVIGAIAVGPGSVLGIILFIVAAVMAVTALVGFCPLYRVIGVNTCRVPAGSR